MRSAREALLLGSRAVRLPAHGGTTSVVGVKIFGNVTVTNLPQGVCILGPKRPTEVPVQSPRRVVPMAYRYQVTCVGWWRGKIKRWNTTFHMVSSSNLSSLYGKMQAAGWKLAGDAVGACSGGVASIKVYASTGGTPVQSVTYFDWQTPTSWIPYTGTAWAAVDSATPLDASGESAAVILGHMNGLSATGKPMFTRKYLHAIPSRTATNYSDPDIDATTQAALAALFPASYMANPAGSSPGSVDCEPYYLNHQRVRGRRRTTNQVVAQSFSAGVVAGTAAGAGGASAPEFR